MEFEDAERSPVGCFCGKPHACVVIKGESPTAREIYDYAVAVGAYCRINGQAMAANVCLRITGGQVWKHVSTLGLVHNRLLVLARRNTEKGAE